MIASLAVDPRSIIAACAEAVAEHRGAAQQARRLPEPLVQTLRDARAFDLMTPVEYGGLELSLAEACGVLDGFGRLDGSVAWTVWNGNMGFSAALLGEAGAQRIWGARPSPVVANSARPSAIATPDGDGFRLDGRWDIVSACEIADWLALFALVPGESPDVRVLYVPRADVRVLDTWQTSGMRATGSHAVVAEGVHVDAELVVSPLATARIDRPLYRIPAFTLASTGGASIVVAMADAALDELAALALSKRAVDGGLLAERASCRVRSAVRRRRWTPPARCWARPCARSTPRPPPVSRSTWPCAPACVRR